MLKQSINLGEKDVKLIEERNAMKNLMDELILKSSSEKFINENREKENILLEKMEEALNEIYPNIALKIFGSRATGLYYDSNSDADIYLSEDFLCVCSFKKKKMVLPILIIFFFLFQVTCITKRR